MMLVVAIACRLPHIFGYDWFSTPFTAVDFIYVAVAYRLSLRRAARIISGFDDLIFRMKLFYFYVAHTLLYLYLAYAYVVGGVMAVVHGVGIDWYAATIVIQTITVAGVVGYQFQVFSQDAQKLRRCKTGSEQKYGQAPAPEIVRLGL
jgi:hypothetical protein